MTAPDYLNPGLPENLQHLQMPVVRATEQSLADYGYLVSDPDQCQIEIVRWPAAGWRAVDEDTGDEGGVREGTFITQWKGDVLYGKNTAVEGHYILGYSTSPDIADESHQRDPEKILLWHSNYHPDGGQLFFPPGQKTFCYSVGKTWG